MGKTIPPKPELQDSDDDIQVVDVVTSDKKPENDVKCQNVDDYIEVFGAESSFGIRMDSKGNLPLKDVTTIFPGTQYLIFMGGRKLLIRPNDGVFIAPTEGWKAGSVFAHGGGAESQHVDVKNASPVPGDPNVAKSTNFDTPSNSTRSVHVTQAPNSISSDDELEVLEVTIRRKKKIDADKIKPEDVPVVPEIAAGSNGVQVAREFVSADVPSIVQNSRIEIPRRKLRDSKDLIPSKRSKPESDSSSEESSQSLDESIQESKPAMKESVPNLTEQCSKEVPNIRMDSSVSDRLVKLFEAAANPDIKSIPKAPEKVSALNSVSHHSSTSSAKKTFPENPDPRRQDRVRESNHRHGNSRGERLTERVSALNSVSHHSSTSSAKKTFPENPDHRRQPVDSESNHRHGNSRSERLKNVTNGSEIGSFTKIKVEVQKTQPEKHRTENPAKQGKEYDLIEKYDDSVPRTDMNDSEFKHHLNGKSLTQLKNMPCFQWKHPETIEMSLFLAFREFALNRLRRTIVKINANRGGFSIDFMTNLYRASTCKRLVMGLLPGSHEYCQYCAGYPLTFKHLLSQHHVNIYQHKHKLDPPHIYEACSHPSFSGFLTDIRDRPPTDSVEAFIHFFRVKDEVALMEDSFFKSRGIYKQDVIDMFSKRILIGFGKFAESLKQRFCSVEKLIFLADKNRIKSPEINSEMDKLFQMNKGKWTCNACDEKFYTWQDIVHHMLMDPSDDHLDAVLTEPRVKRLIKAMELITLSQDKKSFVLYYSK